MGNYTQLHFAAALKKSTPQGVIDTLHWHALGERSGRTVEDAVWFPETSRPHWLRMGSAYFPVNSIYFIGERDRFSGLTPVLLHCNAKNYDGEFEQFLEWIRPHIEDGAGVRDLYAYTINESAEEPTLYYLF